MSPITKTLIPIVQSDGSFIPPRLIAHGGGAIHSIPYTNSIEAISSSFKLGFRLIELDFNWTSDGKLVLIHDWGKNISNLFKVSYGRRSIKEFQKLRMINGLSQLSLVDLAKWIEQHPDVFIVTDVKRKNLQGLATIKEKYPHLIKNFIPQIYSFSQYHSVKEMGYKHIILILYRSSYSGDALINFINKHELLALTMSLKRASAELLKALKDIKTPIYAYTINEASLLQELLKKGLHGVYTDFLSDEK